MKDKKAANGVAPAQSAVEPFRVALINGETMTLTPRGRLPQGVLLGSGWELKGSGPCRHVEVEFIGAHVPAAVRDEFTRYLRDVADASGALEALGRLKMEIDDWRRSAPEVTFQRMRGGVSALRETLGAADVARRTLSLLESGPGR